MNKDIQTLIEREAEEIASKSRYPDKITNITVYSKACVNNYFKVGAHFALSLFKWRKVSEGLPEEYITVLIKNRTGKIMSVYRCDVNEWCIIGTNDLVNPETIEYWMPIPQID